MDIETIGIYAGRIWEALDKAESLGVKQIKKVAKLKHKEIYAGLGWLAREGKILIAPDPDTEKEYIISLVR